MNNFDTRGYPAAEVLQLLCTLQAHLSPVNLSCSAKLSSGGKNPGYRCLCRDCYCLASCTTTDRIDLHHLQTAESLSNLQRHKKTEELA